MSDEHPNYWRRLSDRRLSRRAMLRSSALVGAGLLGSSLLACKGGNSNTGGSSAAKSGGGQPATQQSVDALVGRTGQKPTGQPIMGGTYVAPAGLNPPTFDPHGSSSAATYAVVSPIYSRLLRYKAYWDVAAGYNRETEGDLATSAESADGITWTFKLRPNVNFHKIPPVNGHAVEAEDVKQTFIRATSEKNANRGQLNMIDASQIQTPDSSTVTFKLSFPYAPFSKLMASGVYAWVFPREIANGSYDPAKTPIGSGPFTLDHYTPDVETVFKKNPDFWEKPKPYIDSAKLVVIADPNAQIAQYTAGNIDIVSSPVNEQNLDQLKQQFAGSELYTGWGPGDGQMYIPLGPESNSPFKDIRLRRAMSLLIDRDAMTKVAYNGRAIPDFYCNQSFGKWSLHIEQLPPETAKFYHQDVQTAKQLIDAAGGANLQLKMLSPTPYPPGAEAFWFKTEREMVANFLGLGQWKVNLVLIDYTKDWVGGGKGVRYGFFPSINDSFVWAGLEGRQDIDEYVYGWYHSKSSTNCEHLHDDKLDSMIDHARTIVNDDDRAKAYIDLQKYMADQMFSVAGNPDGLSYTFINKRVVNYTSSDSYGTGTQTWGNLWLQKV